MSESTPPINGPTSVPTICAVASHPSAKPSIALGTTDATSAVAAPPKPANMPKSEARADQLPGVGGQRHDDEHARPRDVGAHHHRLAPESIGQRAPNRRGDRGEEKGRGLHEAGPGFDERERVDAHLLDQERQKR